jgi:hypothetical protein
VEEAAQIYALPVSDLSQRLSVTGTYFVVNPSSNCTAAFGLLSLACPSLPLLSVSDSGLHYLTLPATAPFGSAFALSIAFTNLAALEVALVNVSVVVPPFLQVCFLIRCNPRLASVGRCAAVPSVVSRRRRQTAVLQVGLASALRRKRRRT